MDRVELERLVSLFEAGELSAPLTVARLMLVARDVTAVEGWLTSRAAAGARVPQELLQVMEHHRQGCQRVSALVAFFDQHRACNDAGYADHPLHTGRGGPPEGAHALGDDELLEHATREIIEQLDVWGLLGATRRTLELECGTGYMQEALATRVRLAAGVDASERLVARARKRCARVGNARHEVWCGTDLPMFAPASFDLVYGVDSFPCLAKAGDAPVASVFSAVARVLAPGGEFLILEFSDRRDDRADALDVARQARLHGFDVISSGERPFHIWDGAVFRLRRQG